MDLLDSLSCDSLNSPSHVQSEMNLEVIVVGAGPAGSSTAYHLAQRGRGVLLLDQQSFPRDKACGDGLTPSAVSLLAEMGVLEKLGEAQKIRGLRVFMRGKGSRDFEYPVCRDQPDYGLVVPRKKLDHALCQRAVAAGADMWERTRVTDLLWTDGAVTGVRIVRRGRQRELHAPVVVAADGASSRLARQAGLVETSPGAQGYAIRGYYTGLEGLTDMTEIYMPLMDPSDRYLLPSYGWVFPAGPGCANVGVGLFHRSGGITIRDLFEQFLEALREQDLRFRDMRLRGTWQGAPLRFDFAPERCMAPGMLIAGDAAGLVSPFTGEGISYALESGKLAAEAIDRNLRPGMEETPDLSDYGILMEQQYTGYFEAGRRSARRYLLVWHLLDSTFHNERPLYSWCRRAVLFPEGVGEAFPSAVLDDVSPLIGRRGLRVREDLLAVGEILLDTVRRDWPFLARLSASGRADPGIPFRPALLLLLAGYSGGPRQPHLISAAAAVELGYLAVLAHMSVEGSSDGGHGSDKGQANWGNMAAVMLGDFLLSKAHELSLRAGCTASKMIAEALTRACEGQVRELLSAHNLEQTETERLDIIALKTASLFELPCRLGAYLSGVCSAHVAALATYGHQLGIAFQLADDALELAGQKSQLGPLVRTDSKAGIYGLPVLWALRRGKASARHVRALLCRDKLTKEELQTLSRLVRETGAVDATFEIAREYARRAQGALEAVPAGAARSALSRLTEYVVSRKVPDRPDLMEAFMQ